MVRPLSPRDFVSRLRAPLLGIVIGLLASVCPRAAQAGPPGRTVTEARSILELDLLHELYVSDLRELLARADTLVESTRGHEQAWAFTARARVYRLRGEYAYALADLSRAEHHMDRSDLSLLAFIGGERLLVHADQRADGQVLVKFEPVDALPLAFSAAHQSIERDLQEFLYLLELFDGLAPRIPETASVVDALQILEVVGIAFYLGIACSAARNRDLARKTGGMKQLIAISAPFEPSFRLFMNLLPWPPFQALGRRYPEMLTGRPHDCDTARDPLIRLHCVGDYGAGGSVETLGLTASNSDPTGEDTRTVLHELAAGGGFGAPDEVGELREILREQHAARPLAKLAEIAALRAFAQLAAAARDDTRAVKDHISDARKAALAVGDQKLSMYLRAYQGFIHALEHDRKLARRALSDVQRHIGFHEDAGMAKVLGDVAAALARVQVHARQDLVAADILYDLALDLHAGRKSKIDVILTLASRASMYYRGNATHKGDESMRMLLGSLADLGRDPDILPTEKLMALAIISPYLDSTLFSQDLGHLLISLLDLLPRSTGRDDFEEGYYIEIETRHASEMDTRQFAEAYQQSAAAGLQSAMQILAVTPPTEVWTALEPHIRATLNELLEYARQHTRTQMALAERLVDAFLQDSVRMLYAEFTFRTAQLELSNNPDLPPEQFHANGRKLEWRLAGHQPHLLADILRARGDVEGAKNSLLSVAPMWDIVLAGEINALQFTLLRGYFTSLVETGAMTEARRYLDELRARGGEQWFVDEQVDWRALGAWIRWTAAQQSPREAWPLVERLERELGLVKGLREPRLRLGSLHRREVISAVGAAVDVAMALREFDRALALVGIAQPSIFSSLPRGESSELVNLATVYDILSSQRYGARCRAEPGCEAELDQRLRAIERRYESLLPDSVTATEPLLDDFEANLGRRTAVLTWLVDHERIHIVLIRRDHEPWIVSRELEYLRLRGRIQRLGAWMQRGIAEPRIRSDLEQLASALLPPPERLEGIDNLVIIPSDIVADVPFPLLPWGDAKLVDEFVLREVPTFSELSSNPNSRRRGVGVAQILVAHDSDGEQSNAQNEANTVQQLVHGSIEHGASRASFTAALHHSDLVHVIAHGQAAAGESPAALLLTSACATQSNPRERCDRLEPFTVEDALLSATDVRARRVVFSACEVGAARGSLDNDGFRLGAALLRAGVEEVVVPIWQIDDSAQTAEFWRLFYRQLRWRRSVAEALAWAQREAHSSGIPERTWGAYKVISRVH